MRVLLSDEAQEQALELPVKMKKRVTKAIEQLAKWPNVSGVKALKGDWAGHARKRTGDWRVIFKLPEKKETDLLIVRIDNRKDVYD